jgi:hypothetical protein
MRLAALQKSRFDDICFAMCGSPPGFRESFMEDLGSRLPDYDARRAFRNKAARSSPKNGSRRFKATARDVRIIVNSSFFRERHQTTYLREEALAVARFVRIRAAPRSVFRQSSFKNSSFPRRSI